MLENLRIVSVAVNLPGPIAAAEFAAHGAKVTTILPPAGDPMATYNPDLYEDMHVGQEVVTLDLRSPAGLDTAHRFISDAHVLITSSRPQALVRMGMDFATTSALNPNLVQVDIVGYPGEKADLPGHDLTYQLSEGLVHGELPRTLASDMAGGLRAYAEAVTALLAGGGRRVEVALSEAAKFMAKPLQFGLTGPGALLGGATAWYNVYPTADGHVGLAALEPHFQKNAVEALNLDVDGDLHTQLTDIFAQRTSAQWEAWGAEHDVPVHA